VLQDVCFIKTHELTYKFNRNHAKEKNVENGAREIGQNGHLLVHLPLVGGTIVATFAGSMFKFYCNLV